MEVRYSKDAQKIIKRMDESTKKRIKAGIEGLKKNPPKGDIKPMQGKEYEGYFRLRIGQYRVIYCYGTENEFTILYIYKIGSRGNIYK